MKRYAKEKTGGPNLPPVRRLNLDPKKWKPQVILVAALLAVGLFFLGRGVYLALSRESGWQEIQADSKTGDTCAGEFTLYYDLGASGAAASVEYRQIGAIYTRAAEDAFRLFHSYESFEGVVNLHTLSTKPNEVLTVDPGLYSALEKLQGTREIFLAPVYEQYYTLFHCASDGEAALFDPAHNPDQAEYFRQVCGFAGDAAQIDLRLLGENKVMLFVSQAYLAFAEQEKIENFVDLFWMKDAFIIDYLAEALTEQGYTYASLSSDSGFTRVLDSREGVYHAEILDYTGGSALSVARTVQTGPFAAASLRDYHISGKPERMSYTYADGTIRSCFVDVADGLSRAANHDFLAYSSTGGCGDLVLAVTPIYVAEKLDGAAVNALTEKGIYSVYCDGTDICVNDPDLSLENIYTSSALTYQLRFVG